MNDFLFHMLNVKAIFAIEPNGIYMHARVRRARIFLMQSNYFTAKETKNRENQSILTAFCFFLKLFLVQNSEK